MGKCPVCQHPVRDDFGLIECENCKAQLLVHIDGTVEHAQNQPAAFAEPEPAVFPPQQFDIEALAEQPPETPVEGPSEDSLEIEPAASFNDVAVDENLSNEADFTEASAANVDPYAEGAIAEAMPAEPEFVGESEENANDPAPLPAPAEVSFDEPAESEEAPVVYSSAPPPEPRNPADLSDLADFGNADLSSGREGPLRYNLFISGIDTKDVREAFREALTDRKFVWDTDQILKSIREGQVKIENASATKAYMLVIRLRNLPLHIRWEQHVVHQP